MTGGIRGGGYLKAVIVCLQLGEQLLYTLSENCIELINESIEYLILNVNSRI